MSKNIWAGVIALVIVLSCGIVEVCIVSKEYDRLADRCETMMRLCADQRLTLADYEEFRREWENLRELSELFLPHVDVYEINLRFAEGQAYAQEQDYKQLYAQFCVIEELLDYVPHLMQPMFRHII